MSKDLRTTEQNAPMLLVRQIMVFYERRVEDTKAKIGIKTHPEVNFSTLTVCDSTFIEDLKEYHGDVLHKGSSFRPISWETGPLPCVPFRAHPEEQQLERV
jgi:hypothetical protein